MKSSTCQIIIVRHGEKNGDALTEYGLKQIREQAYQLAEMHLLPDLALYSGAQRTKQAIDAMLTVMDLPLEPRKAEELLLPIPVIKHVYGDDMTAALASLKKDAEQVVAAGGMLDAALEYIEYARVGRNKLRDELVHMAVTMHQNGEKVALCASHSPWSELAAVNPSEVPFGITEAAAVVYEIDPMKCDIVSSRYILGPLPGNSNI